MSSPRPRSGNCRPDHGYGAGVDLPTPCLVVDQGALLHNIATITETLPSGRLRPHVKAFKCTGLARLLADAGHRKFTCATVREAEGMAAAGLGEDLLIANEILDRQQLARIVAIDGTVTLAVDSEEAIDRAARAGVARVLIDVEVGLPRCGCDPAEAGRLAERARRRGMEVRGVMGYEGHLMMVQDRAERIARVQRSMERLLIAAEEVGGEIVSAGGTGTFDTNAWANEIQAGTFLLGDTHYAALDLPFAQAIFIETMVVSASPKGWLVVNAGLKAHGMDHGNPTWPDGELLFCSDEHATLRRGDSTLVPGERTRLIPAHLDPTVAKHERLYIVDGSTVLEEMAIDLRHW